MGGFLVNLVVSKNEALLRRTREDQLFFGPTQPHSPGLAYE